MLGIWYAVLKEDRRGLLTVSFLDVGQGDAILIDAPSGRQVLIDGGPDRSVLRELGKNMPWWDRSIDVVLATHPDQDHINGLVDVLARYRVHTIVHSSVEGETKTFDAFEKAITNERGRDIVAMRGQIIDLGPSTNSGQASHVYLEILFPDRSIPHIETNTGSIVAKLLYGDTSFLLTGDSPSVIENYLVQLGANDLHATVLKAGHHGSKTSSSLLFLGFVQPEFGIFSRGCGNSYGHPSPETVARFKQLEIPTLDTCAEGTITFVSDGRTVSLR